MTISIDRDVPLPMHHKAQNVNRWPLLELEIGESFFVERPIKSVSAVLRIVALHGDRKFTARSINGGTRIWRIA